MRRQLLSLGVWFVATLGAFGRAAANEPLESFETAVHLVGHEDDALLARVQDLIDDWDPRKLVNPYVDSIQIEVPGEPPGASSKRLTKKFLRRTDLAQFIADVEAAEMLGKAFFWEMQAGSDYRKVQDRYVGTACASCHYRFGADARDRYTSRVPYVIWDQYDIDPAHPLAFNDRQQAFDPVKQATETVNVHGDQPLWKIVGSQGVEPRVFESVQSGKNTKPLPNGYWEEWSPRKAEPFQHYKPDWAMFLEGHKDQGRQFRQITTRNSPTVINAGFADRLFHDGRAESTFNGFSIFGDHDRREVLFRRNRAGKLVPARVAIVDAALASQAVGPIVNDVEMSYLGRTFHHVACKLLDAPILHHQSIAADDSLLAEIAARKAAGKAMTYRELIRRAFRPEWWDGVVPGQNPMDKAAAQQTVPLMLAHTSSESPVRPEGELMQANFSLYWGLSILLYEASLTSNQSPFDAMMQGNPKPANDLWDEIKDSGLAPVRLDRAGVNPPLLEKGAEVFQRGLRVFMSRGCIECHAGPLFSEIYERDRFEDRKLPIAHTLDHLLQPFSTSDAIAVELEKQRAVVLSQAERIIETAAAGTTLLDRRSAAQIARELDGMRQYAHGDSETLQRLIAARLSVPLPTAAVKELAEAFVEYERVRYERIGARKFFTETQRVAAAELAVEPVLIEQMTVPPSFRSSRRPLPFFSPLDRSYAFYDAGFYAIGVAPPRYDRGVGLATVDEEVDSARFLAALLTIREAHPESTAGQLLNEKSTQQIAQAVQRGGGIESLFPDEPAAAQVQKAAASEVNAALSPSLRQAAGGVPGEAYRFRREFRDPEARSATKAQAEAAPGAVKKPDPCQAANVNLDEESYQGAGHDFSWDRDGLLVSANQPSLRARRIDRYFFSRARQLVMDEHPWGYRKYFAHDNELAFWGAFKTPTLRNVALTPPYMHNGRLMNLFDVVEFYEEGGDILRDREHNTDMHPEMRPFDWTDDDKRSLVFFLHCLTDQRVQTQRAPFDHPSIELVNGYRKNRRRLKENIFSVPANGQGGTVPPPAFPSGT